MAALLGRGKANHDGLADHAAGGRRVREQNYLLSDFASSQ